MSTLKPPQPPPSWTHTPEQVLSITKETIDATRELRTRIANIPPNARSFSTVFLPLAEAEAKLGAATAPLTFYKNVSPSKELREASTEAESLVRDFGVESSMRVDLFAAIQGAAESIEKNKEDISPESKRLVEKMLLDGKRAGLALPEEDRKLLTDLKKELAQTCLEFSQNSNEETGTITFTLEELDGVPKDVMSGYKKLSGENGVPDRYEITFKFPDITPIIRYASNPEIRRRAQGAFENRLAINEPIFEKAIVLRRRLAKLLGYKTWADFVTEERMVKTADNVFKFLDDFLQKLKPIGIKDREALLVLKREECEEKGYPFDGELYNWDYNYYNGKFIEKTLLLDASLIKEHFPVSAVVPTILNVYQDLLGVRFQELNVEAWHPDVRKYSVWEKDAKDETGFIGYCFLDLFPRENKYNNAAVWPIIEGREISPNGGRIYPTAAMVANLAQITEDTPALMSHHDVVMLFHEMGHIFHELLSRTTYSRFHGTAGPLDYAEAPSQMLENWCWEPKVLKMMSSHYKTKEPLPDDIIERLIKCRHVNVGLFQLKQAFLALFDLKVHTGQDNEDYTVLWNNLREEISLLKNDQSLYPGQAAFGHLLGGYDSAYYGYMYSLVFAADMYATVFKKDPLDPKLGKLYREKVLLPGAGRDESETLKDFLGREPTSDAFIQQLFGGAPTPNL